MRYIKVAALFTLALSASACGWRRTPVPIVSDSGSSALLVGSWSGDYSSRETGRTGSITFDLESERDTAFCDVVMTPKPATGRVVVAGRPELPRMTGQGTAEPLKIRFIRLGDGRVSGTLDPYVDPECGCRVTTVFEGRFTDANTIEGSYVTRGSELSHRDTKGSWKVTRRNG